MISSEIVEVLRKREKGTDQNAALVDHVLKLPDKQVELFSEVIKEVQPNMTKMFNEYTFSGKHTRENFT